MTNINYLKYIIAVLVLTFSQNGICEPPSMEDYDECNEPCLYTKLLRAESIGKIEEIRLETELLNFTNEHNKWALDTIKGNHSLQQYESIAIALIVFLMIFIGLYFSWLHLKAGANSDVSIKISKDGIELNTSVIGLVLLVLTFAYFFVYIEHVYEIKEPANIEVSSSGEK